MSGIGVGLLNFFEGYTLSIRILIGLGAAWLALFVSREVREIILDWKSSPLIVLYDQSFNKGLGLHDANLSVRIKVKNTRTHQNIVNISVKYGTLQIVPGLEGNNLLFKLHNSDSYYITLQPGEEQDLEVFKWDSFQGGFSFNNFSQIISESLFETPKLLPLLITAKDVMGRTQHITIGMKSHGLDPGPFIQLEDS